MPYVRKMGPKDRKLRDGKLATVKTVKRIARSSQDRFKVYKGDAKTFSSVVPVPRGFKPIQPVYRFHQTVLQSAALASSTTIPQFASFYFNINQVDQVASFAILFDEYCIQAIEVWITPQCGSGITYQNMGELSSVIDYNDAAALSTVPAAFDYETCLTTNAQLGHYRCWKPAVAQGLYGGSLFTSYGSRQDQWINTNSLTVPHYGLKTAITPSSTVVTFDLRVRFTLCFRNTT